MSDFGFETCSGMPRVDACPPSAALVSVRQSTGFADRGSAKHQHMYERLIFGVDEAMRRLPLVAETWNLDEREAAIFAAQMRKFEWCPPPGAIGEFPLAMQADGTVYRTRGGRGRYEATRPGTIVAGQLDIAWSEPEPLDFSNPEAPRCPPGSTLWVGDYKSGSDVNVEPAQANAQVATSAVMAAKLTGAMRVAPFVLFLATTGPAGESLPNGEWDTPEHAWGPDQIGDAELWVRRVLERRRAQIERLERGERLDGFNEGRWCNFCPGKTSCPAKVGNMQRVAALVERAAGATLPITRDELAWWASRLGELEQGLSRVRGVLRDWVDDNGPIDLGHGLAWGPRTGMTTKLVGRVVLPILTKEVGEEVAGDLIKLSKKSLEDAVRSSHATRGIQRKVSPTVRRILSEAGKEGGIVDAEVTKYGVYRKPTYAEAPDELDATTFAELGDPAEDDFEEDLDGGVPDPDAPIPPEFA